MLYAHKSINANKLKDLIELPIELNNKEVEILLIPIENDKNRKFDPKKYIGVLHSDDIEKDIESIRNEWD